MGFVGSGAREIWMIARLEDGDFEAKGVVLLSFGEGSLCDRV